MIKIGVNTNFHVLGGKNIFENKDERFKEYRLKWLKCPEKFTVPDFPLFIDIESTSTCNLRCSFCYNRERIKGGFIKFDLVKKIIDEGADNGLYGVKFNFRGEPLLHPEIHKFVKYAKDKGLIDVYFNTHGLKLNEEKALKLIDAKLDRITISFEGYTKDVYEKYRVGSDFNKVVKNVERLIQLRKKMGIDYPKVRVQTVLVPELINHLKEYKNFWLAKGADEVAYLDYKEMKEHKEDIVYSWACPQLWQRMCVWWDGTIIPCNHDDRALLSLGNIESVSIKDAWKAERLNKVRELHKNGDSHLVEGCNGCFLRDSEIRKSMEEEK
ncbi:radical SAM protein [bacterium]|nr:radical SAM protein [bacterium]